MKIHFKSKEEVEIMREGGKILGNALKYAASLVKPGITTKELDKEVERFILSHKGATPGFKGYYDYPATLCTSVNDEVVHSVPSEYVLKEGDIISIDCGVFYKGFNTDAALTVPVNKISAQANDLINKTKESLDLAISEARPGVNLRTIGELIQNFIEKNGYSVVRDLVGHGIGKTLHEDPQVPNFLPSYPLPTLREGMTICIEPMVNIGDYEVLSRKNGTIITKDGSLSCHFEHTLSIEEKGAVILTPYY